MPRTGAASRPGGDRARSAPARASSIDFPHAAPMVARLARVRRVRRVRRRLPSRALVPRRSKRKRLRDARDERASVSGVESSARESSGVDEDVGVVGEDAREGVGGDEGAREERDGALVSSAGRAMSRGVVVGRGRERIGGGR